MEQLPKDAQEELRALKPLLQMRGKTTITGKEYRLSSPSAYRGDFFGAVVATIYRNGGVFQSPDGSNLYVSPHNATEPITIANMRSTNPESVAGFEKRMSDAGFDIPSAGAVLLEFPLNGLPLTNPPFSHQSGKLIDRPVVNITSLSQECKKYILEQLALGQDSYAYQVLFLNQVAGLRK